MVRSPKTQKNPNVPGKISEKNRKKMLDKGGGVWYISQARLRETKGKSKANLENDTEEVNAQEGKISEDSKELNIERCQGLNGRV